MFHVHCLNKISKAGTDCFNENYEVGAEVQNPDAVMVRSASMHEMDFNPELLAIARAGAGVNNIPLDRCSEEGIVVFNTPGANASSGSRRSRGKRATPPSWWKRARARFPARRSAARSWA